MTTTALPPALTATLERVAGAMADAQHPWWVIGGAAAALHGVIDVPIVDVDVVLDTADARPIFARLGLPPDPGSPHPRFRSDRFGVWTAPPLPVEFMAGFRFRDAGNWRVVAFDTRRLVPVGAVSIAIPEADELAALLRTFGRPKDLLRARALAP